MDRKVWHSIAIGAASDMGQITLREQFKDDKGTLESVTIEWQYLGAIGWKLNK